MVTSVHHDWHLEGETMAQPKERREVGRQLSPTQPATASGELTDAKAAESAVVITEERPVSTPERDPLRERPLVEEGIAPVRRPEVLKLGRTGWAIISGALLLAFLFRFTIDDAYISFRYAKNFAEGRGLVFNPGERVEGYTNFLWTMLLAIPHRLGFSPQFFAMVLGLVSMASALWCTFRIALLLGRSVKWAQVVLVILATNAAFVAFGTSGLETMFQAALVSGYLLLIVATWHRTPTHRELLIASVLALALVLTRLDSALLLAVLTMGWVAVRRARGATNAEVAKIVVCAATLSLAALVPWTAWRVSYYGHAVPNTFYAKDAGGVFQIRGLLYIAVFVLSYGLMVPLALVLAKLPRLAPEPGTLLCGVTTGAWVGYVVVTGGDWMDFRFMVPALIPLALLIARAAELANTAWIRKLAIGSCVVGGLLHGVLFTQLGGVDGLAVLRLLEFDTRPTWVTEGEDLAGYFPGGLDEPNQITVGVVAAGALPYFSELPAIDMLGLTDEFVAKNGVPIEYADGRGKPGHLKIAPTDYLVERDVNLILGLPQLATPEEFPTSFSLDDPAIVDLMHQGTLDFDALGSDPRVVGVPLRDGSLMLAVYLVPDDRIDEFISSGWPVAPLTR